MGDLCQKKECWQGRISGYLEKYDRLTSAIVSIVNLPDTKVDLLIKVLDKNKGKLSKRNREQAFNELSEEEIIMIEENYTDIFEK